MPIPSKEILERIFSASPVTDDSPISNNKQYILVTGGAGYIGSHTIVELMMQNYQVIVLDDLSNSSEESLNRVANLTSQTPIFVHSSISDTEALNHIFRKYPVSCVIHFAGLKSVSESVSNPLKYYTVNVAGSANLFTCMLEHKVYNLVFSSSATVYGQPQYLPITESHPFGPTNPYGKSKLMVEDILRDLCAAEPKFNVAILRYFNPIGAHKSGKIGEHPNGIPNNLLPYISQVLIGRREKLSVYGGDYETKDGTGVRDFIHVVDLARGHLSSFQYLVKENPGCVVYNMGTGTGYSVMEMVKGMEHVSGREVKFEVRERRPGDVGEVVADPAKAMQELGWKAERGVTEMCADTWRWQEMNPNGYEKSTELLSKHEELKKDILLEYRRESLGTGSDGSTLGSTPASPTGSYEIEFEKIKDKKLLARGSYGGQSLVDLQVLS